MTLREIPPEGVQAFVVAAETAIEGYGLQPDETIACRCGSDLCGMDTWLRIPHCLICELCGRSAGQHGDISMRCNTNDVASPTFKIKRPLEFRNESDEP